jgi:hypothetical protein
MQEPFYIAHVFYFLVYFTGFSREMSDANIGIPVFVMRASVESRPFQAEAALWSLLALSVHVYSDLGPRFCNGIGFIAILAIKVLGCLKSNGREALEICVRGDVL